MTDAADDIERIRDYLAKTNPDAALRTARGGGGFSLSTVASDCMPSAAFFQ
jgi:hypothetical protein